MKMKLLLFVLAIVFVSCQEGPRNWEPAGPPIESESLDYTWKIDTLRNPYGYGVVIRSLWGMSSNSVWAVGYNVAFQGEIFHYTNDRWERVTPDLGFNYDLLGIYGFAEDQIYAVGTKYVLSGSSIVCRSLIIRYDGKTWNVENVAEGNSLNSVHGSNVNNIWACGEKGTLFFNNGTGWKKHQFDTNLVFKSIFVFANNKAVTVGELFNYTVTDTATRYLYLYEDSRWKTIDSTSYRYIKGIPESGYKFGERAIWGTSETDFYTISWTGAFRNVTNQWSVVAWDDYQYPYNDMKALDQNNIFIVGHHGRIRVFKNHEWHPILEFYPCVVDFYAVLPLTNNLFIGAFSQGQGYIVHGRK